MPSSLARSQRAVHHAGVPICGGARGVLDPLVLPVGPTSWECVERTRRRQGVDRALASLESLVLSGGAVVERGVVCTVANCVEIPELHSRVIKEKGA